MGNGQSSGSTGSKRNDTKIEFMKNRSITFSAILFSVILALTSMAKAQSQPELGGCSAIVEGNRLLVIGNETSNIIEIVGSERGVQVTCDGASESFAGIEEITVEAGDGDDTVSINNTAGFLGGNAISISGEGGNDGITLLLPLELLEPLELLGLSFVAYTGEDSMQIISGPRDDKIDIAPGTEANSVVARVTDIATEMPLANITASALEVLRVEAGDGDDQISADNSNGLLSGIAMRIFAQDGDDLLLWAVVPLLPFIEQDGLYDGGAGDDTMRIMAGPRADRFDIESGPEANAVALQVTDIATGRPLANISGSELEDLTVKMGDGNDQANVSHLVGVALNVLGQEGDDTLTEVLIPIFPLGTSFISLVDLGPGDDKFSVVGASSPESYEMRGVPDLRIPDPEIRVTDLVTGREVADFHVQQTEEIMVEAGGGDDRVEVNWGAALMSGLSLIRADLGRGNDMFISNLLPVLTEPPTNEVQTARFEVVAGRGDDQVTFNHSAGSWFDVFLTADMGLGTDTVNALLLPPPDDGIPGPEGLRQLQFDLLAGNGGDLVAVHNLTTGEFFDVFLETDLDGGDDTFEAVGAVVPCVHPGRGFDTARVTRNLLPFVTEFERVEILDRRFGRD
jgi:hypothetical protein